MGSRYDTSAPSRHLSYRLGDGRLLPRLMPVTTHVQGWDHLPVSTSGPVLVECDRCFGREVGRRFDRHSDASRTSQPSSVCLVIWILVWVCLHGLPTGRFYSFVKWPPSCRKVTYRDPVSTFYTSTRFLCGPRCRVYNIFLIEFYLVPGLHLMFGFVDNLLGLFS